MMDSITLPLRGRGHSCLGCQDLLQLERESRSEGQIIDHNAQNGRV